MSDILAALLALAAINGPFVIAWGVERRERGSR